MDFAMQMPDLATTDSPVTVVRWLVDVGRPVRRGQPLMEVETDKAVMELESVVSGTLRVAAVRPGEQVTTGQVIARFDADETATGSFATVSARPEAPAAQGGEGPDTAPRTPAGEAARRVSFFARNREARATRRGAPTSPGVVPLSVAGRALARRMRESNRNVPHFYLQASANAEPMAARRAAAPGGKTAWDAFFVHAAGRALKRFPRMGYRFEDDRLVPQGVDAVNVAVDLDGDLFTVAIDRPAERTPEEISEAIRAGAARLRGGDPLARVTRPANLTVSNLGGTGVEAFAALISPPESAALAVGRVGPVVVARDGRAAVQSRVTLTLSVDHRVVNGKYAAGFLGAIVEGLETLGPGEGGGA
jgi:pyruvate dehydrogenase E2 component (dihydrolipoamide acetyltransferase)